MSDKVVKQLVPADSRVMSAPNGLIPGFLVICTDNGYAPVDGRFMRDEEGALEVCGKYHIVYGATYKTAPIYAVGRAQLNWLVDDYVLMANILGGMRDQIPAMAKVVPEMRRRLAELLGEEYAAERDRVWERRVAEQQEIGNQRHCSDRGPTGEDHG